LYLVPVLGVTLYLLGQGWRLTADPTARRAWRTFHASNFYLAVVLLGVCLGTVVR
jgi:heme O synthase-like polyprenyltransferase